MKMIIGLGNPGGRYKATRHNLGFLVVDEICNRLQVKLDKKKFKNQYTIVARDDETVMLLKPLTYMNNCGEAIASMMRYYAVEIADILVIYDDLDLPSGKLRLRESGNSAGHNGIKSIIQYLKTKDFKRLRVGIGKDPLQDSADYVLGKFTTKEKKAIKAAIEKATAAALAFVSCDFPSVMNEYNK